MFEKLTKKSHFLNFASEASYVYIFIEKVSKKKVKKLKLRHFLMIFKHCVAVLQQHLVAQKKGVL